MIPTAASPASQNKIDRVAASRGANHFRVYDTVVSTIDQGRAVRGHGNKDMPAWGDAFETATDTHDQAQARIRELANYLSSIQKP